jgi:hypothetical protein
MTAAAQDGSGRPDPTATLQALHAKLTDAIGTLASAEGWQQMLRLAAALPSYSAHNVLLISSQRPDATAVAGFHTWQQLGRSVRKGDKGIAILAPVVRRASEPDAPPAPAEAPVAEASTDSAAATARRIAGFRVVHVFDLSQTTGPDLPEPPEPTLLEGQAPPGLLEGLQAHMHDEGYQLIRHDFDIPHPGLGSPNGVTDFLARTVIVRPDLSEAQTAKTLGHELGHILLHAPGRRPSDLTMPQAEVEAESVAYVVATTHGLDTTGYSIPYVAGWSGGDLELLARSAERVVSTSHQILRRTPPPGALAATTEAADRTCTKPVPACTVEAPDRTRQVLAVVRETPAGRLR